MAATIAGRFIGSVCFARNIAQADKQVALLTLASSAAAPLCALSLVSIMFEVTAAAAARTQLGASQESCNFAVRVHLFRATQGERRPQFRGRIIESAAANQIAQATSQAAVTCSHPPEFASRRRGKDKRANDTLWRLHHDHGWMHSAWRSLEHNERHANDRRQHGHERRTGELRHRSTHAYSKTHTHTHEPLRQASQIIDLLVQFCSAQN